MSTLGQIQAALQSSGVPAWLFADFRHNNPIAYRTLGLPLDQTATRRWYYLAPAHGEPLKIVSAVEPGILASLPGTTVIYRTWNEREAALAEAVAGRGVVAMEYSPGNAVPYVASIDAGTIDLIRSFGVEIVTSADLVQQLIARWASGQLQQHLRASEALTTIAQAGLELVKDRVLAAERLTDHELQGWLAERMTAAGLAFDHPPIVATNANASDPHFEPRPDTQVAIQQGDVLLVDFWGKVREPQAVYADYTWMAWVGEDAPAPVRQAFGVAAAARNAAIDEVARRVRAGERFPGFVIDDVARAVVRDAGLGEFFIHRTGHNIGQDVHGEGANIDNFETHDVREVLPGTCFSIEPGIYQPAFGIRTEVNVYHDADSILVTGGLQRDIIALLSGRPIATFFEAGGRPVRR